MKFGLKVECFSATVSGVDRSAVDDSAAGPVPLIRLHAHTSSILCSVCVYDKPRKHGGFENRTEFFHSSSDKQMA